MCYSRTTADAVWCRQRVAAPASASNPKKMNHCCMPDRSDGYVMNLDLSLTSRRKHTHIPRLTLALVSRKPPRAPAQRRSKLPTGPPAAQSLRRCTCRHVAATAIRAAAASPRPPLLLPPPCSPTSARLLSAARPPPTPHTPPPCSGIACRMQATQIPGTSGWG